MYAQRKGGLVFLTKKQWNPSNIRNLEKVYLAEQKAEHERKMAEQLRRENAEKEEMLQLRQASTGKTSTGLEWMYESVLNSVPQVSAEEYLCGKEVKDLDALRQQHSAADAGAAAGDAKDAAGAASERDMMAKVLQDPLLLMKKAEQSRIQAALANPVKMASIAEEKTGELYAEYAARVAAGAKPEKIDRAFQRLCHIVKQDKSGHARMKLERLDRGLALSVSAALRKKEEQKSEKRDEHSHHHHSHHHRSHHRHHSRSHSPAGMKRPKEEEREEKKDKDDAATREAKRQRREYGDRYGLKTGGSDRLAPRLQVKAEDGGSSASDSGSHRHHSRERADGGPLVNDRQKAMEGVRRQRRMTADERAAALARMQEAGDRRFAQRLEGGASADAAAAAGAGGTRGPDERPEFLHGVMSAVYGTGASLEDRLQRNAHRLEHPDDE